MSEQPQLASPSSIILPSSTHKTAYRVGPSPFEKTHGSTKDLEAFSATKTALKAAATNQADKVDQDGQTMKIGESCGEGRVMKKTVLNRKVRLTGTATGKNTKSKKVADPIDALEGGAQRL